MAPPMIGDYKALIDHGSVTDVIALVNDGGDVNAVLHIEGGKQPKHFSALAYAAFRLQLEVARALVELGAHVRETRPHHVPAFSAAAFSGAGPGCHALLRFLWEQDPSDVKRCDSQSCTAAHYAASRNACEATLRMLHGWEVPMNTLNCKMRTPLHYTLDQGAHAATLFLVSEVGAPVGPHVATMIDAGDAAGIMTLHKEGIWTSVDEAIGTTMAQPPWSFTALAHATVRGQTGIMELLIADLGASVNERRQWFEVPAMAAAAAGSVQALRLLNDGDGAFRPQATNGRTPAHNAATCGSAQCLVYLQEHGCPMDGGDQEGYNPAHLAAHQGHDHIIKLLHGWGCDLGKPTAHGNTAAEYAKSQEHDGTAKLIRRLMAEREQSDRHQAVLRTLQTLLAADDYASASQIFRSVEGQRALECPALKGEFGGVVSALEAHSSKLSEAWIMEEQELSRNSRKSAGAGAGAGGGQSAGSTGEGAGGKVKAGGKKKQAQQGGPGKSSGGGATTSASSDGRSRMSDSGSDRGKSGSDRGNFKNAAEQDHQPQPQQQQQQQQQGCGHGRRAPLDQPEMDADEAIMLTLNRLLLDSGGDWEALSPARLRALLINSQLRSSNLSSVKTAVSESRIKRIKATVLEMKVSSGGGKGADSKSRQAMQKEKEESAQKRKADKQRRRDARQQGRGAGAAAVAAPTAPAPAPAAVGDEQRLPGSAAVADPPSPSPPLLKANRMVQDVHKDAPLDEGPVAEQDGPDDGAPLADNVCLICFDAPISVVLIHANEVGHRCVCVGCADILKKRRDPCPMCRAETLVYLKDSKVF